MSALAAVKLSSILNLALALKTADAAVGVDTTLSPEGFIQPGVARWVDRSGGIPVAYPTLTMSVRPPTKASRIYKVTVKLLQPTLETVTGSAPTGFTPAPAKAYDLTAVLEFMIPERSSLAEREALFRRVMSLFARTINASDDSPTDSTASPLEAAVTTFEQVY